VNNNFDFEDLDAAVADLLKEKSDTGDSFRDREKIISAEKAEVREKWNLPKSPRLEASEPKTLQKSNSLENEPVKQRPRRRGKGQFMDMVDASSDATLYNKPNRAHHQNFAKKAVQPKPSKDSENSPIKEKNPPIDFAEELGNVVEKNLQKNSEFARKFRGAKSSAMSANQHEKSENEHVYEDSKPETPFLPGVKVEKNPLSTARPTGEIAAPKSEELLKSVLDAPDETVNPAPELELSEDNFISKFLGEIKNEAIEDDAKQAREKTAKEAKIDHLPKPKNRRESRKDTKNLLDNSMIMSQYKSSETAQIIESPAPFAQRANVENGGENHSHIGRWILIFALLVLAGFAVGAWWYLTK